MTKKTKKTNPALTPKQILHSRLRDWASENREFLERRARGYILQTIAHRVRLVPGASIRLQSITQFLSDYGCMQFTRSIAIQDSVVAQLVKSGSGRHTFTHDILDALLSEVSGNVIASLLADGLLLQDEALEHHVRLAMLHDGSTATERRERVIAAGAEKLAASIGGFDKSVALMALTHSCQRLQTTLDGTLVDTSGQWPDAMIIPLVVGVGATGPYIRSGIVMGFDANGTFATSKFGSRPPRKLLRSSMEQWTDVVPARLYPYAHGPDAGDYGRIFHVDMERLLGHRRGNTSAWYYFTLMKFIQGKSAFATPNSSCTVKLTPAMKAQLDVPARRVLTRYAHLHRSSLLNLLVSKLARRACSRVEEGGAIWSVMSATGADWLTLFPANLEAGLRRRQFVRSYPAFARTLLLNSSSIGTDSRRAENEKIKAIIDAGESPTGFLEKTLRIQGRVLRHMKTVPWQRLVLRKADQQLFPGSSKQPAMEMFNRISRDGMSKKDKNVHWLMHDILDKLPPEWLPVTRRDWISLSLLCSLAYAALPHDKAGSAALLEARRHKGKWENLAKARSVGNLSHVSTAYDAISWLTARLYACLCDPDAYYVPDDVENHMKDILFGPSPDLRAISEFSRRWHLAEPRLYESLVTISGRIATDAWPPLTETDTVTLPSGTRAAWLLSSLALLTEGRHMRHCVGGYSYSCTTGNVHIVSFTHPDGERTTAELFVDAPSHVPEQHQHAYLPKSWLRVSAPREKGEDTKLPARSWNITVRQHKGIKNDAASPEQALALEELRAYVRDVLTHERLVELEKARAARAADYKPELALGFDTQDSVQRKAVLDLTREFLPSPMRHDDEDALRLALTGHKEFAPPIDQEITRLKKKRRNNRARLDAQERIDALADNIPF